MVNTLVIIRDTSDYTEFTNIWREKKMSDLKDVSQYSLASHRCYQRYLFCANKIKIKF